jgi:membrane protease YdiL (CAAX protease family)
MLETQEKPKPSWMLLATFLFGGLIVVLFCMTYDAQIPVHLSIIIRLTLIVLFFVLDRMVRRTPGTRPLRRILQALLAATVGLSLSWYLSPMVQAWIGFSTDTPMGIAMAKLASSVIIVACILLITRWYGFSLTDLYLCKGKPYATLLWGTLGFGCMVFLAFLHPANREVPVSNVIVLVPAILVFILSNAFMEGLLVRALFVKTLQDQSNHLAANLATAIVFTAGHLSVSYTPDLLFFLGVLFLLALAWGFLMQKTGSIIGPALFHAGADVIIVLGVFHSMGVNLDG